MENAICTDRIKENLNTEFIGKNIIAYATTDSTNARAKELQSERDGTVFIAESQTDGKGSKGRRWISQKGEGVWMSILLKPQLDILCVPQITLVAGLALKRALGDNVQIKWPNDVVCNGKKLCGILTEAAVVGNKAKAVVCGIGVNVNQSEFPKEIEHRATSLYLENNKKFDTNALAADIINEFESLYKDFLSDGLGAILSEYSSACVTLGREIKAEFGDKYITGVALGVDTDGALIVQTTDGRVRLNSGDVSVRGIYGYI